MNMWSEIDILPYVQPVFRPPAEAGSVILQVTVGCSWNQCKFCEMYTQEQQEYRVKPLDDIRNELSILKELSGIMPVRRIFLADGDAMGLPTKHLRAVLESIRAALPDCSRVSSYCLPRNIRRKTVADLDELRQLGLRTMYVGCESGDDEVLRRIGKGETRQSHIDALQKLHAAGLKTSVMLLHGLGGKRLSKQHVEGTALLVRSAPPNYLSTLVVSFPLGTERFASGFSDIPDGFVPLTSAEVLEEQRSLLEQLHELPEGRKIIFRSDHASNYLPLKGTLPKDRERLLSELGAAQSGITNLRPEWARGL